MKTLAVILMGLAAMLALAGCGRAGDNDNPPKLVDQPLGPAANDLPDVDQTLTRLIEKYPVGKNIPPGDFHKDADVKRLSVLADRDVDALLGAVKCGEPLMVMNPESFQGWKSRVVPASLDGPKDVDRSPEGYDKYLADVRRHDEARCLLQHKRWIVTMMLQKKVARTPAFLKQLLEHKNTQVRQFAIRRVIPRAWPAVEYWDGGIHLMGKPPSVLFAAWADGMIVRRSGEKTVVGFVAPETVSKLVAAIRAAGFFTPSGSPALDAYGLLYPDGPVRCLSVLDGDKPRSLYYHERDKWNRFDKIGPSASPSRQQREQFVAMWKRVLAEIEKIRPDEVEPFGNARPLTYPGHAPKR